MDKKVCENCGAPIGENEKKCSYCGTPTAKNSIDNLQKQQTNSIKSVKEEPRGIGCFVTIIILIFCIIVVIFIPHLAGANCVSCLGESCAEGGGGTSGFLERPIRNGDLTIDSEYDSLISVNIVVVAHANIKNLSLKLTFYDKNNSVIKTMTKYIGNIESGDRKDATVSLTDFNISEAFKINSVRVEVENGVVSYLG